MKVLLLHQEDSFARWHATQRWDLVVDLSRAPIGTYERWSTQAGCPVISIYDYSEETEDLYRLRELLALGLGRVIDRWGIDWWDVFSLEIASKLQHVMLVHRLAKELPRNCELYSTRPDVAAGTLQRLLGSQLIYLSGRLQSARRRMRRYYEAFSRLDNAGIRQVVEDRFDADHSIRRRFAVCRRSTGEPVVLLPSAYVNVSRTALSYAALLPNQQFMLVAARRNGYPPADVPPNVRVSSLTPYFGPADQDELASLFASWDKLKESLAGFAPEFETAESEGLLGAPSAPFAWGVCVRDAWLRFFDSENVIACLTADDSNPNTRIPLILAGKKGVPALACHHGAFDFRMSIKMNHADFYLAKSEMERDYLRSVCHLAPEKIVVAATDSSKSLSQSQRRVARDSAPWLVFFTEPYQSLRWRSDEVYRDLLPHLWSLAQSCGLKLVFKLHPFESLKEHRRILRCYLPEQESQIQVFGGPPSAPLWDKIQFALTVQSSAAAECVALGIPVFLCAWLRDPYSGYVQQYARFGVGHVLESPEQIAEIPRLLGSRHPMSSPQQAVRSETNCAVLAHLFSGSYSVPVVCNA
jgi:hypothetical protein